jgi:ABC-type antimicrobial peptide transport system permease subunit
VPRGQCVLNAQTAEALDIRSAGGEIVLSVPAERDVPADATLARRSRQDTLSGLRVRVSRIVSEPGMLALFSPTGEQRPPRNAWVNLADLQDAVAQRDRVNALFAHERAPAQAGADELNAALRRVATLLDYGLSVAAVADGTEVALTSRTTYLDPPIEQAADRAASATGIPLAKININLINAVERLSADGRAEKTIHYAVAAGITSLDGAPLNHDEVALNKWAADQLGATLGDRVALRFYSRAPDGKLVEISAADRGHTDHFRIARILPMAGIGADPSLTPTYRGLTDAQSVSDWNPPEEVKIDKSLVSTADEEYWKQYKAAPKLFVSFDTARMLWGADYGTTTSVRVPADRADEFVKRLLAVIDPASLGLSFRPLRREQIAAASGTTDFGQLFIGFSFFLIVAAALLVAMLLRLGVEQRARQLGAMSALGFSPGALRRIMLSEGMTLAIIGGIVGTFAAIGYTWLLVAGLRTWWVGAVGTTEMRLHVVPQTLAMGLAVAEVVALLAILWAIYQVGRAEPARLLAGGWEQTARPVHMAGARVARLVGRFGLLAAVCIITLGAFGRVRQQDAFMAGGAILLASGLCLIGVNLRPRRPSAATGVANVSSVSRLGVHNASRHAARSVLCVGLIALASFALVAVAAMRQGEPSDTSDPRSGALGFQLIVESDIPLLGNPGTEEGRALLGFREPSDPLWDRVEFLPMRRRAGQDVSCLNLTRATSPTILAVPPGPVRSANPTLQRLDEPDPSGAIPVIADDSTATYILHLDIGQTIDVVDSAGAARALRLVATLPHSIFQSQLLMSEEHFRKLYPAQSGFGVVLARVEPPDQERVLRLLSDELGEYGAAARTTASVLAGYLQVQNTYLSTFELLGALGLMLGTIGLAVVLVRTVIERRGELALLAAIGFRTGARVWLVLAENAFLLVTGLMLGTLCALVGVLPAILASGRAINFASLTLTLAATLLVGLGASAIAVLLCGGTRITAADLRRE